MHGERVIERRMWERETRRIIIIITIIIIFYRVRILDIKICIDKPYTDRDVHTMRARKHALYTRTHVHILFRYRRYTIRVT